MKFTGVIIAAVVASVSVIDVVLVAHYGYNASISWWMMGHFFFSQPHIPPKDG